MSKGTLPILNWAIATFFCVFQFYLQASASLMVKPWSDDFNLSPVGVSTLSSAFFYTYLLMQVPVGYLNDRFNPRWILSGGLLLVAMGCFMLASTHQFGLALVARLLMGLGSSFGFVSMLYISAQWFKPEKFVLMVGYSETIGMVGVALSAVISAGFISLIGWRGTIFYSGLIALLTMLLALAIVRDKPKQKTRLQQGPSLKTSLLLTLKEKNMWLAGLFGLCNFSVINAICSLWGVPFLRNVYHLSLSLSAAIVTMIFYGMAIGSPLVGYFSQLFGKRKPIILLESILGGVLLTAVIFVPNLSIACLFFLFFAIGLCASSYIQCFAFTKELTPASSHGISLAITNMLVMLGAPIYQLVIGGLLQSHFFGLGNTQELNYQLALSVVPLSFFIAFVLALFIKETFCKTVENAGG